MVCSRMMIGTSARIECDSTASRCNAVEDTSGIRAGSPVLATQPLMPSTPIFRRPVRTGSRVITERAGADPVDDLIALHQTDTT